MKVITISSGQSLVMIAYQNGLDWRSILDFNPELAPPYALEPGLMLIVPETSDLRKPPELVFAQIVDARNKLLKLSLGSYANEKSVLAQLPQYQPTDTYIARASWLPSVTSIGNQVIARQANRQDLSSSINWTNIG